MIPTLLNNRYRLLQEIGEGGFGKTFLVEDTYMPSGRRCVLKQLKPLNPQIYAIVQQRFQREAALLEALGESSPQIPSLYAYFAEAGQFYLVQEWIDGQTLEQRVHTAGPLPEAAVRMLLSQVLPVLAIVHQQQIIHRDIKPENIILRHRDQQPVLIDFGAVKEVIGTVVNSQGQTTSSIVIGTPGFMPPEQAAGRPIFSSDLYALGLTAIFALSGKGPADFPVDPRTGELLWQPLGVPLSDDLAAILNRAIQGHPRDRFSTATEMLAALQARPLAVPPTELRQPTVPVPVPIPEPIPATTAPVMATAASPISRRNNLWPIGLAVGIGGLGLAVGVGTITMLVSQNQPAQEISTTKLGVTPPSDQSSSKPDGLEVEPVDYSSPSTAATQPSKNRAEAEKLVDAGYAKEQKGDYQGSLADYSQAAQLDPDYALAYVGRGWAHYQLENLSQALQDFNRAIELDPQNARAYNNRGIVYYAEGDYAQAIADYNRAIELNHEPLSWPYYNRGLVRDSQKNPEAAIADYTRAIDLDPSYADAYFNRAIVHDNQKNRTAAIADYQEAATLYQKQGNTSGAESALKRIDELDQ